MGSNFSTKDLFGVDRQKQEQQMLKKEIEGKVNPLYQICGQNCISSGFRKKNMNKMLLIKF